MRTSFVPGVYRLPNVLLRLRHPVRTECVRRLATRPVQKTQNVETLFILRCYLSLNIVRGFHPPNPAGVFACRWPSPRRRLLP